MFSDFFDQTTVIVSRDNSNFAFVFTPTRVVHRLRCLSGDSDTTVVFHRHCESVVEDAGHVDTEKQAAV